MTTGALIFAFNNEHTDYLAMAAWSADRIRRHLSIPVAVITDCIDPARLTKFDRVIAANPVSGGTRYFDDYKQTVTWYNASRTDAYSLTPWDQTLLLDADYVVCGDELTHLLEVPQDFMCYRLAWDITRQDYFEGLNYFGQHKMPMWWATVIMFRKSNMAQYIFDSMNMIKQNWQHYKDLYHITGSHYRNDYALSIALGIVSGHTLKVDNIPWMLASVLPEHEITQIDEDHFEIKYQDQGKLKRMTWHGMDFHAMGKKHLGDIIASAS
jgi:hypothetical protein